MSILTRPRFLPRAILALYVLLLVFAVCMLWHTFVTINNETKAVEPEESPHIEFLTKHHGGDKVVLAVSAVLSFMIAAAGAVVSLGTLKQRGLRWASFWLFLLYGVMLAASRYLALSAIPFAAIVLFALYALYEAVGAPDMQAMVHFKSFFGSLREMNLRGLLRFLVKVMTIFAVSGALMLIVETLGFTIRVAYPLFSTNDFMSYGAYAAASGALACGALGTVAVVPATAVFLLSRVMSRARGGLAYLVMAIAPPIWFALATWAFFFGIIYYTFQAEITRLGLLGTLWVLSFVVGYLLLLSTYINFKFILKRLSAAEAVQYPRNAGDYALFLVIAMIALPLLPLALLDRIWPRRIRIRGWVFLLGGLVSAAVLLYLAGFMNYPMITEYSYTGQSLYSIIMIGVVACTIFMLVRFMGFRRSPRLVFGLAALVAIMGVAMAGYRVLDLSQNMRLLINEYAPLGRTTRAMVTSGQGSRLGMDTQPAGAFEPYGPKHKRLPLDPGLGRDFVKNPPPIIYIILDAARPDRMRLFDKGTLGVGEMYTYGRDTTPRLRGFAKDFSVFTNAYGASTATSASMKNIFSGCFATRCITDIVTLKPFFTNDLLDAGYGRFFINYFHDEQNGVSMKAFLRTVPQDKRELFAPIMYYDEKFKVKEALDDLTAYEKEIANLPPEKRGYFMYLHFCTTHFPWKHFVGENYYPGAAYYGESNEDLYDETMQYADIVVGHFLDGLKEMKYPDNTTLYDKAVIIISADHGTGLNEHGKYAGFFSYQEQIRVPLLIKIPGVTPRIIAEPSGAHDIAPTIVNLVRRDVENRFDGVSLLPLLTGSDTKIDREFLVNIDAFHDSFAVIQNNRWKLIYHRDRKYYMLFDLQNDPYERHNLSDEMPDKCAELIGVLERFLWQGRDSYANPLYYRWPSPSLPRPLRGT
jgi:arylsulfatase A-like enzyme